MEFYLIYVGLSKFNQYYSTTVPLAIVVSVNCYVQYRYVFKISPSVCFVKPAVQVPMLDLQR